MGPQEARELCPHVVIVHTATYRPGETESGYWEDANVLTHKVGERDRHCGAAHAPLTI